MTNLLLNEEVARCSTCPISGTVSGNRSTTYGFAGGLMSSLAYFDAYTTGQLPINLLQAQRDYFGAHTYQRTPVVSIPEWQKATLKPVATPSTRTINSMQNHKRPPASLLFIFGGSSDYGNHRKLSPALYNLFIDAWMPEKFSIVGISRRPYTDEDYRTHLLNGILKFSRRKERAEDSQWAEFSKSVSYLQMDAARTKITRK